MVDTANAWWPCIGEVGLEVFTTTADQRYLLGEDLFLQTHYPVTLRRFYPDRPSENVDEAAVLDWLLHTRRAAPGNRVLVLYGAAGSGKSELIKWLHVMMSRHDPIRAEAAIRIARTELDVLSIAERFHHLLTQSYFDAQTHRRWDEARCKPRTLAKLLLLTALERCLDDDEQINALYYRLLNWVQPRIARSLTLIDHCADAGDQVELLTREDLEQLKTESVLPIPLDYEQFRHHLAAAFREHLLEGTNLPETLRLISEDVSRRQGARPVLLIDDLVQSVNLFATDLLDYFITLESGNWDVVAGLTPGAMESSARGRELLDRIAYLDTIDDRVEKLWLSDMQGHTSYFLTETNCHALTARYLTAYRARNGWTCAVCPHQARCAGLDGDGATSLLAPFNQAALRRLFRGLPEGKGKARHLLKCLREILAVAADGESFLNALSCHIQPDVAVETDDEELAHIAELYGPSVLEGQVITLTGDLLAALGLPAHPVTLRAEPLRRETFAPTPPRLNQAEAEAPSWIADADKTAIQTWLKGGSEAVNRQSLLQLRRGLARWLRTVHPTDSVHSDGIARPHRALRWTRTHLATRPPIHLEDVDEYEGIVVASTIGHAAFELYRYAKATGEEAAAVSERLAQDERLLPALFAAADYRRQTTAQLEVQLGLSIAEVALALYAVVLIVNGLPEHHPPGFSDAFWEEAVALETQYGSITWGKEATKAIHDLFDDVFKLRDNVYDGPWITRLLDGRGPEALLEQLQQVDATGLDKDYQLGGKTLRDELIVAQDTSRNWEQSDGAGNDLSQAAQKVLDALLTANGQGVLLARIPTEVWPEIQTVAPEVYAALQVRLPGNDL
ncbi:MAG: hypothetical protein JXA14_26805 [Anaerolineae bacterium]|nr:hypothetical protein [Anaerolineae bacterium]